jgi:glycosyltransferase involved in cell wall biosynthesis
MKGGAQPTRVYHFGPSTGHVGGMGSAITSLVAHKIGAESVVAVPTWVPGSHLTSGLLAARAVALVLRVPRCAVIHAHMSERGSFLREAMIVAAARCRQLSCIITIHGADFSEFSDRHSRLVRMVLNTAGAVTVLSEADLAIVRRLAPRIHAEIVPNVMPLDPASGPAGETSEIVLFAGEVGLRKGADVLHRAWGIVAARRPRATCVMVGPVTELRLPQTERLEVRGPVGSVEVKELIREARVIALPSRREALPMILLEAMAAGRPFVSTPIGGTTSLADGGVIVPVEDHVALASALIALLADRERAQALGSAGRIICQKRMSPEVIAALLGELYKSVGISTT